jgi:mono/diheme cytochrome c family protein
MKRILRWLVIAVVVLLVVVAALVGYIYVASARLLARTYTINTLPRVSVRSDPSSLARGKYLVEHVAMCVECHGNDLGGKIVDDSVVMGRLSAANLTRGRGGIGASYSDEDFVRAVLHGVKRDGHTVVFMPSADYQFTEEDFGALVGYIRSVPPVDRVPQPMSVGPMARALGLFTDFPLAPAARIDHAVVRFATPPNAADPTAMGAYLVSTGACRGCHGADFTGGGGPPPGGSNLTPVGIGGWTEQQFMTAIREHKRPDGSTIDEAMPRMYGQMSDGDLRAIFAFLRTVPPAGEKSANQKNGG